MKNIVAWVKKKTVADLFVIMIFAATIVITVYFFSNGINGNDFWWHIKIGEWVSNNKCIPHNAIFSWYNDVQNISWIAHEWLSEVIFWNIYNIGGEFAVFVFCSCTALLMQVILLKRTKEYLKKNPIMCAVIFCSFSIITSIFFYGRPHIFSFFLLLCELVCLYDYYENVNNSRKIYFIPFIALLWSNLHGGSSNISYILCIAFLFAGLCKFEWGCLSAERMEKRKWFKLLIITIISIVAVSVNPNGIEMLFYPYENMNDGLMLSVISEWRAPDAKNAGTLILYFVPIALMLLGMLAEKVKLRWIDVIIMAMFICLFMRSERFIVLWYIAIPFCAMRYIIPCHIKETGRIYEKILIFIMILFMLVPLIYSINNIKEIKKEGNIISKVLDSEMIDTVKQESPRRLYNDYNLGEALIWNDISVFVDGRADIYSSCGILADAISIMTLKNVDDDGQILDFEKLLNKYNFDGFLILKKRPLYIYLVNHPDKYKMIKMNDTSAYFSVKQ